MKGSIKALDLLFDNIFLFFMLQIGWTLRPSFFNYYIIIDIKGISVFNLLKNK